MFTQLSDKGYHIYLATRERIPCLVLIQRIPYLFRYKTVDNMFIQLSDR